MITNVIDVECEINKEDIIACQKFYMENDPKAKRSFKILKLIGLPLSLILVILGIILIVLGENIGLSADEKGLFAAMLIVAGIFEFIYFLLLPKFTQFIVKRTIGKIYKNGQNAVMGIHKYSISSDGVRDIGEFNETNIKWTVIDYISEADKHLFIRIRPNAAYIIPKRAFPDDSTFNKFVQDVKAIFQTSKTTV